MHRILLSAIFCLVAVSVATRAYAPPRRVCDSDSDPNSKECQWKEECENYQLPSDFSIVVTDTIANKQRVFTACAKNTGAETPAIFSNSGLFFTPIESTSAACYALTKETPFASQETFWLAIRLSGSACFGKYALTIKNPPIPIEPCPDGTPPDAFGVCKKQPKQNTDPLDCDTGYIYDGDLKKCVAKSDEDTELEIEPETSLCTTTEILVNGICCDQITEYYNEATQECLPRTVNPEAPKPLIGLPTGPTGQPNNPANGGGGCSLIVRP